MAGPSSELGACPHCDYEDRNLGRLFATNEASWVWSSALVGSSGLLPHRHTQQHEFQG